MKVLLLGGTGVFGSRLARLLIRDGHAVTVAARHLPAARKLADALGATAIRMDRTGDLSALAGHEVLVDAAGPFHTSGATKIDPYRLARAAIAARVHYFDLSDDAAFCEGISALDADARAAGVCVISGLSTVPALSSAVVRALAGDTAPRLIDTAILPGNRSPRGISVMTSILAQAGRPMTVWRGGAWVHARGWSDPRDYVLPGGSVRQAWQIEVPDQSLFPAHFGAESVVFRAGLELGIMRYGLAAFAVLRRWLPIPVNRPLVRVFKLAADLLSPFGTGRGGMSVQVIVGQERRWWRLLAEEGDGPFIPAVAARAMLRRPALPAGARPALDVIDLEEAVSAMADLRIRTETASERFIPIFPRVLGSDFDLLPRPVRATHGTADVSRWQGVASVRRGTGLWSRFLGRLFGFPPAGDEVPVQVTKTVTNAGETWQRRFGTRTFRSRLAATADGMTESFGPFTFLLGLEVRGEALFYPVKAGWVLGVPLPRWLLPASDARECAQDGRFVFDVRLVTPLKRDLLVHYRGHLAPLVPEAGDAHVVEDRRVAASSQGA
ncbi:MAG: DUF4166 domain-containing protein [Pseudomonadota bacterium]